MRRKTPRRNVPVPTAGSATVTSGEARPLDQGSAQSLVNKAHHSLNRLRRRVIRACALAQLVVVQLEEVFVEVDQASGLSLLIVCQSTSLRTRVSVLREVSKAFCLSASSARSRSAVSDQRVGLAHSLGGMRKAIRQRNLT